MDNRQMISLKSALFKLRVEGSGKVNIDELHDTFDYICENSIEETLEKLVRDLIIFDGEAGSTTEEEDKESIMCNKFDDLTIFHGVDLRTETQSSIDIQSELAKDLIIFDTLFEDLIELGYKAGLTTIINELIKDLIITIFDSDCSTIKAK